MRMPGINREIVGLRVRRGLFGKVILQVQFRQERIVGGRDGCARYGDDGRSRWRDCDGNNTAELLAAAGMLKSALNGEGEG